MMNKFKYKILFGALIIIFALLFTQFKKNRDEIPNQYITRKNISLLPEFHAIDIEGNLVKSSDFKGKNLYVQFVDPLHFEDIDLIKSVYSNWKDEDLTIITVTNDIENFVSKTGINLKDIILINNNYEEIKSNFSSPLHQNTYYLFNGSGGVITFGKNRGRYERGVKIHLKKLIKNEHFSISDLVLVNDNIKNISWFHQVAEIVDRENKNLFIISLFTSFNNACSTGAIIEFLNKIFIENQNSVYVSGILNSSFNSEKDIVSLKSQSQINFPLIIANPILNCKWDSLIHEFREIDLTDIVFIIERDGRILKVYDKECRCWNEFQDFLSSLILKRG